MSKYADRLHKAVRAIAMLACALPVCAQFGSLTTNGDGSVLYFTSALRQAGTDQPDYGKIFLADDSGVHLLGVRDIVRTQMMGFGGAPGSVSNFYHLVGVDISSNGRSLAAVGLRDCIGLTAGLCRYADRTTVYDPRGESILEIDGHLALSPNGKWGLATALALSGPLSFRLVDLESGIQYPIGGAATAFSAGRDWRQHDVSDDGTAVVVGGELGMYLFHPPNQFERLTSPGVRIQSAVLDAAANTLVWAEFGNRGGIGLATLDGGFHPLALPPVARHDYAPQISDDGQWILFLSTAFEEDNPQIFVMDARTFNRRGISSEPEGIASAVLSGNGEIAWALTRTGRLIRIEIAGGTVSTISGPVPAFLADPGGLSLALGQTVRLPASLRMNATVEVEIDGTPYRPVRLEDQWVTFQIPWDMAPFLPHNLSLRPAIESGWKGTSATLRGFPFAPRFTGRAIHEDFQAEVTPANPAKPGEVVHLFATGLGPVDAPPPVGSPAPDSPRIPASNAVICSLLAFSSPIGAEVISTTLAPGRVGIYQLDVRIPLSIGGATSTMRCEIPGNSGGFPFDVDLPTSG